MTKEKLNPKTKKMIGCLIPTLAMIITFGVTFGVLISQYESGNNSSLLSSNTKSTVDQLEIFNGIRNTTYEQKRKISEILDSCGISQITNITYDEGLEGLFTSSDTNSNGKEDGYRISTSQVNNIIMYVLNGEVIGVRFADKDLYKNGSYIQLLTEIILSDKEKVSIITQAEKWVKNSLVSPSSARFPLPHDWVIWKEDGVIYVQGYVDAQNALGANIRSQFQIKVVDNVVVSYIFDGEEKVNN